MNIRRRVQWERVKRGGDTPPLTTLSVPPMFLFTRQKKTCTQLSQAAMGHYETENSPPYSLTDLCRPPPVSAHPKNWGGGEVY